MSLQNSQGLADQDLGKSLMDAWYGIGTTAAAPPLPTCGQCENYQHPSPDRWGYCKPRAAADLHPCNFASSDTRAANCRHFVADCPF